MNLVEVPQRPEIVQAYHLRRSGGHGVVDWIFGHHSGRKVHYNQSLPQRDGRVLIAPEWVRRVDGDATHATFELASFEDISLEVIRNLPRPRRGVLILRDPFNTFASRVKMIRRHAANDVCGHARANLIELEKWKQYGRGQFLAPQLVPDAVRVNFNRWYQDQDYRREISEQLGWTFTDAGFGSQAGWEASRGSSFDEADASRLDIANRWRSFVDDEQYQSLFDEEIRQLSWDIFRFRPQV